MSNRETNFLEVNRKNWDDRAAVHFQSEEYAVEEFIEDHSKLSFEADEHKELGDIKGKEVLHLMCHIGLDTLSFARLGAIPTGVDFSEKAIEYAEIIKEQTQLQATFIQSDIYELPKKLNKQFDIVFTSIGVLCWLPDLDKWAEIIYQYLKPGGLFYLKDGHPFAQIFEYSPEKGLYLAYPYEQKDPFKWQEDYSYAGKRKLSHNIHYEWQHSLSVVINALTKTGLIIETFNEYNYLTFKRFDNMIKEANKRWVLPEEYRDKIPLLFSIKARKPKI